MKELSIEEKAKRYDEALGKARRYYDEYKTRDNILYVEDMEDMFPELKESEDERIRKWIIGVLSTYEHDRDLRNAAIAYLEKQGEQKPANKVEPKFKVGDWISGYYTNYKVLSVNNDGYLVEDVDGNKINILFENEKFHHLFTIADAKDGDVLAAKTTIGYPNPFIAIYKEHGLNFFNSHCFVSLDGEFHEGTTGHSISDIHPATKEQCDFLFQKMKEAGYELDDEKKELKKIELQPSQWNISDFRTWQYIVSDVLTKHDGIGQYLDDGFCKKVAKYMQEEWNKKLSLGQNTAEWSEEDKKMHDFAIRAIGLCKQYAINHQVNGYSNLPDVPKKYEELQDWLKSLKGRYTWKPSEGQMDALGSAIVDSISSIQKHSLESLYNELKKLF